MTTKYECDQCGAQQSDEAGLLRIERVGVLYYIESLPKDFCSWGCVTAFAMTQSDPHARYAEPVGRGGTTAKFPPIHNEGGTGTPP